MFSSNERYSKEYGSDWHGSSCTEDCEWQCECGRTVCTTEFEDRTVVIGNERMCLGCHREAKARLDAAPVIQLKPILCADCLTFPVAEADRKCLNCLENEGDLGLKKAGEA